MAKARAIIIVIGLVVVVAGYFFVNDQTPDTEPTVAQQTTLRNTTSGTVVGFIDKYGARSWQGIGFAQPPVGELRWRAPLPPLKASKVIETLAPGPMCPQFNNALTGGNVTPSEAGVVGQEDCLYLNIWSPPNANNLPVMVWIHGGGNSIGHAGNYNGSALASQQDVVVVSINYRLGVFGWFSHVALETGDPADDSGNFGTLDTVRALQWVQNNIVEFGGNADNVTVFGESAGGYNALALMASPLAEGLMHRVIVQSGGFGTTPISHARLPLMEGGHTNSSAELLQKMLIADERVDAANAAQMLGDMSSDNIKAFLYSRQPDDFFIHLNGRGFGMTDTPRGFGDGHVLPGLDLERLFTSTDNHNAMPIIIGNNRDEPALFMVSDPRYIENFLGFLPRLKDPNSYLQQVKYGALRDRATSVDNIAEFMTLAGNPNVYTYRFDWDEEPSRYGFDLSKALGAAHGLEIAFAFGEFDLGFSSLGIYPDDDAQYALSKSMMSYWAEFAYAGNPGSGRDGHEVPWLAWRQDDKTTIILDSPADQGIFMDDQIVTLETVKSELINDTNFGRPELRCEIYTQIFRAEAFNQEEYAALGDGLCGTLEAIPSS